MKFVFNLVFYMIVAIVLILFIGYAPVKALTYIGIWLLICGVIGLTIGIYKIKHR